MKTQLKKTGTLILLFFVFAYARAAFNPVISPTSACNGAASINFSNLLSGASGVPVNVYIYNPTNTYLFFDSTLLGTLTVNNIPAGTYNCSVYQSINSNYIDTTITITNSFSLHAAVTNTTCPANAGWIAATVSGGTAPYSYLWGTGATTATITGLGGGTYRLSVTDATGCTDTLSAVVSAPSTLSVSIVGNGNVCHPELTVHDSTGSGTLTYLWSTGATTDSIAGTYAYNIYTVTATSTQGCTAQSSLYIGSTSLQIDSNGATSAGCNTTGSITPIIQNGTAPYQYLWSTGATTSTLTGIATGNYAVTITDAHGCQGSMYYYVGSSSGPTVYTQTISPTCGNSNGTIYLDAYNGTAPYTYAWSNNSADHRPADTLLAAGTYTYTVTDAHGCIATASVQLTSVAGFSLYFTQSAVLCPVDTGNMTVHIDSAIGNYTFLWSDGQTTDAAIGLTAPIGLTVTVTDSHGCPAVATDSLQITSPVSISFTASACAGTLMAVPAGGIAPYTYIWSTGATTSSISTTANTYYYVQATDAHGCTAVVPYATAGSGLQIDSSATIVKASCSGSNGSIAVHMDNGTAPYTYVWSSGTATDSIDRGLATGTYHLTVTDAGGCSATASYHVGHTAGISLRDSIVHYPGCAGGTGIIQVLPQSGTAPYTYLWGTGSTADIITGLQPGTYEVTVTDANGCAGTDSIYLPQNNNLNVSANTLVSPSCNAANGSIYAYVYGGAGPFSYLWSGGATADTLSHLAAGQYTVTVTDAATGCTATGLDSLDIANPLAIGLDSLVSPGCGLSDGMLGVYGYYGSGSYSYNWSGGATGAIITQLHAGTYTVTVTDLSGGCSITASYTLSSVSSMTVSITVTPTACDSSLSSGTATAIVTSGGTAPYSYQWYGGFSSSVIGTTQTITGLPQGYVDVYVTDANGCTTAYTPYDSIPYDPSCYDNIIGYIYDDSNSNCIYDPSEQGVSAAYVTATGSNGQVYWASPDSTGFYDIQVLPGTYIVAVTLYNYYGCAASTCTSSYQDTFTTTGEISSGNNFGVSGFGGYDLGVHIGYDGSAPGQQREYWIYYYNHGVISVPNGVLTFVHDPNITLVNTIPSYTSYDAATHTITWDITNNLAPMSGIDALHQVVMNFDIPATLALGTALTAYAQITPIIGDCDTANNTKWLSGPVSSSHDPNEKEVSPAGNITTSDSVLTYTVRFQNTGNAPANTIVIRDTLSANVNPATVVPGASSAPYKFTLSGTGVLTFTFQGINLPDSTHGDSSTGFVNYTVNIKAGLPVGAVIDNTASIYFDINPAIVTNTTVNTISDAPNGISVVNGGDLSVQVVPNPAHDQAVIGFTGATGAISLHITDALGHVIAAASTDSGAYTLDAQSLAPGVYFYTATDAAGHRATGKVSVVH